MTRASLFLKVVLAGLALLVGLLCQFLAARSIIEVAIRPRNRLTVTEWTESRNWTESTETYEAKRSAQAGSPLSRGSKASASRPCRSDSNSRRPRRILRGLPAEPADRDLVWRRTGRVALGARYAAGDVANGRLPAVVVGSKGFPESWILGAALTALVQETGTASATHRKNLGGTEITYQALKSGSVDAYPEYTGTIAEVILKGSEAQSTAAMRAALAEADLSMSDPLGFNDGYALAVTRSTAARLGLANISDLKGHPDLRLGFTHEFLGRPDGFPGLARRYALAMREVRGVQHELAYEALARGQLDVMDIYTTDPQIEKMSLVLLRDDLAFFPRYDAVLLYRRDLATRAPSALQAMTRLAGRIDEKMMMRANAAVALHGFSAEEGARKLLVDALGEGRGSTAPAMPDGQGLVARVFRNVTRHLELVGISLFFAVLVGVPLGIAATRSKPVALVSLAGAGLLQTVPSLALLAFLIPLLGIGTAPALVALFVYGLLPIVQSTYTGLTSIPSSLSEAADAIGLRPGTKLRRVALPMASPAILSGIKTSAVINVGTATLAALIGAEGLGNPILQGIALRDTALILEGSIPAALLALLVQGAFSWLDSLLIPEGLRRSSRAL